MDGFPERWGQMRCGSAHFGFIEPGSTGRMRKRCTGASCRANGAVVYHTFELANVNAKGFVAFKTELEGTSPVSELLAAASEIAADGAREFRVPPRT